MVKMLDLFLTVDLFNIYVNTISWSDDDCNLIVSGSDDQFLTITDAFTGQIKISIKTGHKANIFSAKFMPKSDSKKLVSCAADGSLYFTDLNQSMFINNKNKFECHGDKPCYEICNYIQDNQCFASCGQDGCVKIFDLRQTSKCDKMFCQEHTLIKLSTGISAMSINPNIPYHLVCAGLDGVVRFYDRRCLSVGSTDSKSISQSTNGLFACFSVNTNNSVANTTNDGTVVSNKRITSLQYDYWGNELLVSYQSDNIYLLDWRNLSMENKNDLNELNSELMDTTPVSSSGDQQSLTQTFPPGRKFRISTDWSDTGPASMPINGSIDNNDPRSFLLRRLNDWFSDFYQNRTARNQSQQQQQQTSNEQFTTPVNFAEEKENDAMNEEYDEENDKKTKKRDSSDSGEESTNSNTENTTQTKTRTSLTSYLIGSRFKMKQAMKLENNVIKSKPSPKIKQIYTGHRNARTMIKECNYWGNDYVISGSDCGHIFMWDKKTAKVVNIIEADKHVVNCVQENPLYPVLASSGIDYNIKIWQPILEEAVDVNEKIETITKRNKLMLNEIKNTIFIPVQFMVPALRLFGANMRSTNRNLNTQNRNTNE